MNAIKWISSYMAAILIWPFMLYIIMILCMVLPIAVLAKYFKKQLDKEEPWKW